MPKPLPEPHLPPEISVTTGAARLTLSAPITPAESLETPFATSPASPVSTIEELLKRMQAGERTAAAEFLYRYETRIRRRIRGKLGPDIRRLFDSLDIVSTLGRRLDLYMMSGQLRVTSEGEILALLFRMADHALIDKARLVRRLENVEGEDSEFAQYMAHQLRQDGSGDGRGVHLEVEKCIAALRDPIDRRILSLWLTGDNHVEIAGATQLAPTAVRKRWQDIKATLRERFPATA